MQVKLRVIGGKNDGREIKITIPEFVIGRGEQAHLRPNSDLVSRHHCSIKVEKGKVTVLDAGSRNGTFINGQQITEPYAARPGDILRVGHLQFELVIDHGEPGTKLPKAGNVAEVAARTAERLQREKAKQELDEESITDWLTQPSNSSETAGLEQETRQFRLDETNTRLFVRSSEISHSSSEMLAGTVDNAASETSSDTHRKKREPGKLPDRPKSVAESTKSAADQVLRKFFNRR